MSQKRILGLWLSLVLIEAEAGGTTELNGVLGESVNFKVKASPPFQTISWTKIVDNKSRPIAVVTFKEPCGLLVPFQAYQKRVNISKDCRELHLSQLEKEDAGRYTAGIVLATLETTDEPFDLRVFSRLLSSHLRVTCTPEGAGKGGWQLNCSKEPWEDGVKFSWSSDAQSKDPTLGSSVIKLALCNVTCLAENLVSEASRTVSLKEVCAEHTETLLTENRLPLWALLCLSKVGSLLLLGCLGLILKVKSSTEAGGTTELNGVLGESVNFKVKASPPFQTISWTKIVDNKSRPIAVVTFKEPCGLLVPFPEYQKRVNISKDCRELYLSQLEKEDAGRYTAGIVLATLETTDEPFDLRVFRRLLGSEMRVTCAPDATKNGTWKLNCSTGTWEDGVKFSWTSDVQSKDLPLGNSSILSSEDLNLNVTCTAENVVSKASTTVSLKQVCAAERPGTEAPEVNGKGQSANNVWKVAVIPIVVIILIVAGIVIGIYLWRRKAAKESGRYETNAEIENPPRSDSTLIGDQTKETRRKTNQPARRAAKNNQEVLHTIYSTVQHPKQNHLQTDDEKIQKGRRHQTQAEKTIYSEITKSQESEDPNIKTIYDTVQNPQPVKSSGL